MRRESLGWGAVLLLALAVVTGASQSGLQPKFEVASVKFSLHEPPFSVGWSFSPGGRFVATDTPLVDLIELAYFGRISGGAVFGGPDWVHRERINVEAKTEEVLFRPGSSPQERNQILFPMLRSLLEDRFKLVAHTETKEESTYELTVAKNGGKLQLAPERDCDATGIVCHDPTGGPRTGIKGLTVSMADLADMLTFFSDRRVVDKTGLIGNFDIQIAPWTRGGQPVSAGVASGREPPLDPANPDLSTVIKDLGLELKASKGPVERLVIDRIERPSENRF